MEVKQIYELVNTAAEEATGKKDLVSENLLNLVDVGKTIENARGVDNYVRSLVDHIGRMIFVSRSYSGTIPSVLKDGWEFGSILQKVSVKIPEAQENESWELVNGTSYDPNIFTSMEVSSTFYNGLKTFEVPYSITERQVKSSFNSAEQMNAFLSSIYTAIDNSMTLKTEEMIRRVVNYGMASAAFADFKDDHSPETIAQGSGVKCVNLLHLYNTAFGKTLTATQAMHDPDFIRFASKTMMDYATRMRTMSTLFNVKGEERFTPSDKMNVVLLSDFMNAAKVYLYGGNGEFKAADYAALPAAEIVPYWQGSGTKYDFADTSKIDVFIATGGKGNGKIRIQLTGVLGCMFDTDSVAVCNQNQRITSNYNAKAEFTNYYEKWDANYLYASDENFVVFVAM